MKRTHNLNAVRHPRAAWDRGCAGSPMVIRRDTPAGIAVRRRSSPCCSGLLLLPLLVGCAAAATAAAQVDRPAIVFPPDAGVVDVTQAPYHADPTGRRDSTAAIQQALDDTPSSNKIIYLPEGSYLVSDTLRWGHGGGGSEQKRQILQGAGKDRTFLRLADRTPGYTDPGRGKAVLWTGQRPAQRFRNAIRDVTVDTGRGNGGAIGIQFIANNQGTMRNVRIRSGDGQGLIGLDMRFTDEIGPLLVRNLHVIGFDRGVWTNWDTASVTFEHVTLEGQNVYGWHNRAQKVFVRGLRSRNAVTAIYNEKDSAGHFVLVEAELIGTHEAAGRPAILNERSMYVRDLATQGYLTAIRHNDKGRGNEPGVAGPNVDEWESHHTLVTLFPTPERSLRLPVVETPEPAWHPLSEWAGPLAFGGRPDGRTDAAAAIQQAIDSGARTVYLPNGHWRIDGEVVLRGNVERLIGTEAYLSGNGRIRLADGAPPAVVLERLQVNYGAEITAVHDSARTMVLSSVTGIGFANTGRGTGDVFFDDWVGPPLVFRHPQRIFARQLNQEADAQSDHRIEAKVVNDGATLWILGIKTERPGVVILTRGGGRTEVLGGYILENGPPKIDPAFINDNSHVALLGVAHQTFNRNPYSVWVVEQRGQQRRELRPEQMQRSSSYVGYALPPPD